MYRAGQMYMFAWSTGNHKPRVISSARGRMTTTPTMTYTGELQIKKERVEV